MDLKKIIFELLLILPCFIGFSQTGPGGVGTNDGSSDLVMWYRTDNALTTSGSNVTIWGNSAGYSAHDMIQNGSTSPQLISGSLNGYDEIQFNASGILRTGLNLTTSNFITNQASSFIYAKANSITSSWPYANITASVSAIFLPHSLVKQHCIFRYRAVLQCISKNPSKRFNKPYGLLFMVI